jgi:hypothetical protein
VSHSDQMAVLTYSREGWADGLIVTQLQPLDQVQDSLTGNGWELNDNMKVVRLRCFREVACQQPSGDHEFSNGGKFVVEAANEIVKAL